MVAHRAEINPLRIQTHPASRFPRPRNWDGRAVLPPFLADRSWPDVYIPVLADSGATKISVCASCGGLARCNGVGVLPTTPAIRQRTRCDDLVDLRHHDGPGYQGKPLL